MARTLPSRPLPPPLPSRLSGVRPVERITVEPPSDPQTEDELEDERETLERLPSYALRSLVVRMASEGDERRTLDLRLDFERLEHREIERTLLLPVEARAPRLELVEDDEPPFVPNRRRSLVLGTTLVALSLAITLVAARMGTTTPPAPKSVPTAAFP